MKVLLCKGRFAGPISGSDETLVAYAMNLKAAGYDVAVAVLYPYARRDPYYARLREAGVPVSCIAGNTLLGRMVQLAKKRLPHLPSGPRKILQQAAHGISMTFVQQCRAYFAQSKPGVIHVMTPDPAAMAMIRAAHAAEIPVLYHELGTPDFLPELTLYYEQLVQVLPFCASVAALSPSLARRFSEKFPCSSVPSVLPLIVDGVPRLPSARPPSREVAFGFAARMEYGKGTLSLVEAFARVRRRAAGVSLRMAGDGPQRCEAEGIARDVRLNGECAFVGAYVGPEERNAFMHSIDVLMVPSLAEGTPNCVIEAMAHGLPVIASAVGGIPDVISPETGILVAPGDVAALADAMAELANNPARRTAMGRAARDRYEALFSPAVVVPLLADHYRRVIGTSALDSPKHPWHG
jgi:glycosyltransferase involved in cell wall biosynthesis